MHKVSVIIPTFNRAHYLLRAIESVINQSLSVYEIIIVDDGSTDWTQQLVNYVRTYYKNIRYVYTQNNGVSAARNIGVAHSKGQWIAFLDSDDIWLSKKNEYQINYLKLNPHIKLIYGDEIWIRNDVRVNQMKKHKKSGGDVFIKSLPFCFIGPSTVLMEKRLYTEMNGFDESFTVCEDYDLWLKISSLYEVGFIEKPLIQKYGGHADQLSTKYYAMDMFRVKSISNIIKIRNLDETKLEEAKRVLKKKCHQLKKGYLKYGHLNKVKEVEKIELSVKN